LHVSALELENYRNFERVKFSFDGNQTAVCGDNARGKSNLLESIYFLAIGKSGRGTRDRDVVKWGTEFFSIDAVMERDKQPVSIRIAYDSRVGKKKAFLDATPLPRLSDLVGRFNAVLFSPEDVDLVLRDPPQRRRLLDILVSQCNAAYLSDLDQFRRALSQRNRLLKESNQLDSSQLAPWNAQMAEIGARIVLARLEALDAIRPIAQEYYTTISGTPEVLGSTYRSLVKSEERDRAQEVLADALLERQGEEFSLGYTLSGPHRDNLLFDLDGRSAHQFASKGQLKSVLLAWKLSEATFLESRTGDVPVLLMDDIFSELDGRRAESLLDLVGSFGQVVLTSARDPDLEFSNKGYTQIQL
jgi:DNA replication and repair protein RecF